MNKYTRQILVATVIIFVPSAHAQTGATATQSCAEHLNTSKTPEVGALLNCLVEMQRAITRLEGIKSSPGEQGTKGEPGQNGLKGEKGDKGNPGMAGKEGAPGLDGSNESFPSGAIIAFDSIDECPQGWNLYKPAQGRFLMSSGQFTPEQSGTAYSYPPGHTGGSAQTVTKSFKSETEFSNFIKSNEALVSMTKLFDGTAPDEIWMMGENTATGVREFKLERLKENTSIQLPPFIALKFCIKSKAS